MRGRKPKPTSLRLVGGNAGRRPLNHAEPTPEAGIPKAPPELGEDARAEWRRTAKQLHDAGILTKLDRPALIAYCDAYGRWAQAQRVLATMAVADPLIGGLMIRSSKGNAIQNPILSIANKAAADMVRYAVELGMTPSARTRVKVVKPPGPADRIAQKYFS